MIGVLWEDMAQLFIQDINHMNDILLSLKLGGPTKTMRYDLVLYVCECIFHGLA